MILSLWWQSTARFDEKIREAQRLDAEYRELLLSFSDSLFDIINALNDRNYNSFLGTTGERNLRSFSTDGPPRTLKVSAGFEF